MKKFINITFIFLSGLLLLSSCEREKLDYGLPAKNAKEGTLNMQNLKTSIKVEVEEEETKASSVNLDDYIITIYDKESNVKINNWKYKDLPEVVTLNVGDYRVEADSHEPAPVEWEAPFYSGNQVFDIRESSVTEVESIICRLSNVKVSVRYSEELLQHITGTPVVEVSLGAATAIFEGNEQRAAYFKTEEDKNVLISYFTAIIDGKEEIKRSVFEDVRPGDHRVILYAMKTTNPDNNKEEGEFAPNIVLDATCTIEDKNVTITPDEDVIPDDPDDSKGETPDPSDPEDPSTSVLTIEGNGFDIKQAQQIPSGGTTIIVNMTAEKGIAGLKVTIDSETLTPDILEEVHLAANLDLVNPGQLEEGLRSLGFPVKEEVEGKTELKFDISQFTSLLGLYGPATHKFVITLTDQSGKTASEVLTLISE